MKRLVTPFLIVFLLALSAFANTKRYDIKSAIITYEATSSSSMYGMQSNSTTQSTTYIKDWGAIELKDELTTQTMIGQSEKIHSITKIDNGIVYTVDFDEKLIMKIDINKFQNSTSIIDKNILKDSNTKKIGVEKILGYTCEIWQFNDSKAWLYKGVPLKLESNMMGVKYSMIAKSAKFNVSIPSNKFALPDFPIQSLDENIYNQMPHKNVTQPTDNSTDQLDMDKMLKTMGNIFGN